MRKFLILIISVLFFVSLTTNVNAQSRKSYKTKSYKPKTVHVPTTGGAPLAMILGGTLTAVSALLLRRKLN